MTKTKTKTRRLLESKDFDFRLIQSTSGREFLLFDQYMVRVCDTTPSSPALRFHGYRTYFYQSLPKDVLKRIFNSGRQSGKIRNGWPYIHIGGTFLTVGCQRFAGDDYTALRKWATGA